MTHPTISIVEISSLPANDSTLKKLGDESTAYTLSWPLSWGLGSESTIFSIKMLPPVRAAPAATSSAPAMAFSLTNFLLSLFILLFILVHICTIATGRNVFRSVLIEVEQVVSYLVSLDTRGDHLTDLRKAYRLFQFSSRPRLTVTDFSGLLLCDCVANVRKPSRMNGIPPYCQDSCVDM